MKAKVYTEEKWFETEVGLKGKLKLIYLLVDCYFHDRGYDAMLQKHAQEQIKKVKALGLVSISEHWRVKITAQGKQWLREHRLTHQEHADLRREYQWMVAA